MKKFFQKTFVIVFLLIFGHQQFCYADVVFEDRAREFAPTGYLIGFIGLIILIIFAISFFCLKSIVKKQSISDRVTKNLYASSLAKLEKVKNFVKKFFYVWGVMLLVISLIYLGLSENVPKLLLFIPAILFVVSFIIRLIANKKLSNIICAISVILACSMAVWIEFPFKMMENYNNKFLKYEKYIFSIEFNDISYVSDVEGLLNTAISDNKFGRKITLIYQGISYTSINELNQLLSKLNAVETYAMRIRYDENYDYIESIELVLNDSSELLRLMQHFYSGSNELDYDVRSLISNIDLVIDKHLYGNTEITIVYISETDQTAILNFPATSEEIIAFENLISRDKKYNMEFQSVSDNAFNVTITPSV